MCTDGKVRHLSIYYQNVRGLVTKCSLFKLNLIASLPEYDIIVLTETWLYPSIYSNELFHDEYTVYRCDRDPAAGKTKGGGCLIAVRNKFQSVRVFDTVTANEEVWIKVTLHDSVLYMCSVYFPPNTPFNNYQIFYDSYEPNFAMKNPNIIIFGDFNLESASNNVRINHQHFSLLHNLKQLNEVMNQHNRVLDLILTNQAMTVVRSGDPLVPEDMHHPALSCTIEYLHKVKNHLEFYGGIQYNFRTADFAQMYKALAEISWKLETVTDVDVAVERFYETIYEVLDKCVPKTVKQKRKYHPWFTKEIIKNLKSKERTRKLLRRGENVFLRQRYNFLRSSTKNDIKRAYRDYVESVENSIRNNVNSFWSFIKSTKNTRVNHTISMTYRGNTLKPGQETADAFAEYFESVFHTDVPSYDINNSVSSFPTLKIESDDVKEALIRLAPKRSVGPDGVPPFIYKACWEFFVQPLTQIFNLILQTQKFPIRWKVSKVCPIPKTGNKGCCENYRPVTLLNIPSKIFESILCKYIYADVRQQIVTAQHGFLPGRSVLSNLTIYAHAIIDSMSQNKQTDVVYTDFAKAFDRVHHDILLSKMSKMNISSIFIKIVASYLANRKQYVVYNSCKSKTYYAISGVPQGSNLGPLLFLIYVNDLPGVVRYSECLMFADDVKLFRAVESTTDCELLQEDINRLTNWANQNKLDLNVAKCVAMSIKRKHQPINFSYNIDGNTLERVTQHKDLGVVIDDQFCFNKHIANIVKRAYQMLGFILRNSVEFASTASLKLLYSTYVRPHLEFASNIWCPYYMVHDKSIERIQKKFLKYLYFKKHSVYDITIPYSTLLAEFDYSSLQSRRTVHFAVYTYKIISGLMDCPLILQKITFNVPKYKHRHVVTFSIPRAATNYHQHSPIYRMMRTLNKYGTNIDLFSTTLTRFKSHIKKEVFRLQSA